MNQLSVSPSKGKTKESSAHWHAGWWDFYPLTDSPRPLQWSQSSIIFTAHPTQPLVTARHFSSSKQFAIPSPKPVTSTPSTYEPPTVISVAPGDEWLFAYFPKNTGEGTGCLWKRGPQIDNWIVQEWWSFPHQSAPIAANWLSAPREWTINKNNGLPERLPPHGPILPTSSPTLILVTQDYRVHVCYYQYYIQNLQIIKCPLGATAMLGINSAVMDDEPAELVKLCTSATIGISYNADFQLLIAAKLCQFTVSATQTTPFDPMDLTVPVQSQNKDQPQGDWDSRNDDYVIAITQVYLRYDGLAMAVYINPLTPISVPNANIFRMDFLSCPIPTPPEVTSSPKKPILDRGEIYLAVSYLDFEGYVSAPKSQITLYSITRKKTPSGKLTLAHQLETTRTFSSGVLTYIASNAPHLKQGLLPVIILDTSGQVNNGPPKKPNDIVAGKIHMLSLPSLDDRLDWEPTDIKIPFNNAGKDLPLQAVPSPNGVLFYTTSLLSPQPCTSVQFAPVPSSGVPPLTHPMVLAILNKRSPSDICHYLSSPTISLQEVTNTLKSAMTILDANNNGLKHASILDILGIAVEVYRKRSQHTKDEGLRRQLVDKWQTAHDICSVAACNIVFGDCAAGNVYDLDAMWQLTGLANWVIRVTEKIMKECVTFVDIPDTVSVEQESEDDLFGSSTPDEIGSSQFEISPALLHLIHPFALQNLINAIKHVKKYRQYIGSLPPRTTNAQISKDYLVDLVDCSGVNLGELEGVLEESLVDVSVLQVDDCRASLASCQPTPSVQTQLKSIVQKIANSPNSSSTTTKTTLNKAVLFIKASDLIDGISNLGLDSQKKKNQYQVEDVVTRGVVMTQEPHLMCSRCGGSSRIVFDIRSPQVASDRWRIWEKMWSFRCVCGGSWLNKN